MEPLYAFCPETGRLEKTGKLSGRKDIWKCRGFWGEAGERRQRIRMPEAMRLRRTTEAYRLSLREWMVYGGEGIAFCALAAYVFYRSPAAFAVTAPLGMLYPLYKRRDLQKARLLADSICSLRRAFWLLSSFLSAGYSLGKWPFPECERAGKSLREQLYDRR